MACYRCQQLLTIQMTKTSDSTVGGDTEQLLGPVDFISCITLVPTHAQKAFEL